MISEDEAMAMLPTHPAIITPTIPERAKLLGDAAVSVKQQTTACVHHIYLDHDRIGPALIRNTIMLKLRCELVGFLDDDDVLDPEHVEVLSDALAQGADLAFSWYRSEGAPETERVEVWDDYAYGVMLGGRNLVPVTVIARRASILAAGGFNPQDRYEDYSLFMRMLAQGCKFVVVPRVTWTYRMQGENRTWLSA